MRKLATGLALAVLSATSASAANQTFDVTFSANSFSSISFNPPPVDPVTGSFRITFDTTKTYLNDTADIQAQDAQHRYLVTLVASPTQPPGCREQSAPDQLVVGGLQDGRCACAIQPRQQRLLAVYRQRRRPTRASIRSATRRPASTATTCSSPTISTGSIGVTPVIPSGMPEPSTWAMMLLGFAGLGYAGFRRTPKPSLA